jgi:hypothetical protein
VAIIGAGILTAPALSTVADAVSRLAPASVRGEATGLQSSAMSAGVAFGSPIVGVAIGLSAPAGGFAAAGLAGLGAALTGCLLARRAPADPVMAGLYPVVEPAEISPLVADDHGLGAVGGKGQQPPPHCPLAAASGV